MKSRFHEDAETDLTEDVQYYDRAAPGLGERGNSRADISTTMRYAAYVNTHAVRSVKEAQRLEEAELQRETSGRQAKWQE